MLTLVTMKVMMTMMMVMMMAMMMTMMMAMMMAMNWCNGQAGVSRRGFVQFSWDQNDDGGCDGDDDDGDDGDDGDWWMKVQEDYQEGKEEVEGEDVLDQVVQTWFGRINCRCNKRNELVENLRQDYILVAE